MALHRSSPAAEHSCSREFPREQRRGYTRSGIVRHRSGGRADLDVSPRGGGGPCERLCFATTSWNSCLSISSIRRAVWYWQKSVWCRTSWRTNFKPIRHLLAAVATLPSWCRLGMTTSHTWRPACTPTGTAQAAMAGRSCASRRGNDRAVRYCRTVR